MDIAIAPHLLASRTPAEQWQLAYHEAGHAIVRRALRIPLVRATIAPNADGHTGGCVHCDGIEMRHVPTALMAGIVAERLHAGVESPPPGARGWIFEAIFLHVSAYGLHGPDIQQLTRLAQQQQVRLQDYIAQGSRRARTILQKPDHWRAVTALAAALNEHHELTIDKAAGIITRSLKRQH